MYDGTINTAIINERRRLQLVITSNDFSRLLMCWRNFLNHLFPRMNSKYEVIITLWELNRNERRKIELNISLKLAEVPG